MGKITRKELHKDLLEEFVDKTHLAENMPHLTADGNYKYGWQVTGNDLQFIYEEVE